MADPIGEIPILITGDYSGLADDFSTAQSLATDAAGRIAGAFTDAATNADTFSGKVETLGSNAETTAGQIGQIQTALGTLDLTGATTDAENFGGQLIDLAGSITLLGGNATTAASDIGDLGGALDGIGDKSGDLDTTAGAIEGLGTQATTTAGDVDHLGTSINDLGDAGGLSTASTAVQTLGTDATTSGGEVDKLGASLEDLGTTGGLDTATSSVQGIGTDATTSATDVNSLGTALDGVDADSLTGASTAVEDVGSAATTATGEVTGLGTSLDDVDSSTVTGDVTATADAVETLGTNASNATPDVEGVGGAAEGLGGSADEATPHVHDFAAEVESAGSEGESAGELLSDLFPIMGAFAGLTAAVETLKDFAGECLDIANQEEKTQIALTALTGNAGIAAGAIEGLKEIAVSDALSMPQLLTADQRMVALGIDISDTPALLQAAADAAAATGRGFDQVTSAIDRMVISGTAGARQLANLGISSDALATAIGTDSANMAAAFKAMDPSDRVTAIEGALGKFQGVAEDVAQSVGGQATALATQFELAMTGIGQALAPAASAVLSFANDAVIPMVKDSVAAFGSLAGGVGTVVKAFGQIGTSASQFVFGVKEAGDSTVEAKSNIDDLDEASWKLNTDLIVGKPPEGLWDSFIQSLKDVGNAVGIVGAAIQVLTSQPLPSLGAKIGDVNAIIHSGAGALNAFAAGLLATGGAAPGFSANAQVIADNIKTLQTNVTSCQKELTALAAAQTVNSKAMVDGVPIAQVMQGAQDNLTKAQQALNSALGQGKPVADAFSGSAASILSELTDLSSPSAAFNSALQGLNDKFSAGQITAGQYLSALKLLEGESNTSVNSMNNYVGVEATLIANQDAAKTKADALTAAMLDLAQKGFDSTSPVMQKVITDLVTALKGAGETLDDVGLAATNDMAPQVIAGGKLVTSAAGDMKTQIENVVSSIQDVGGWVTTITGSASGQLKTMGTNFGDVGTQVDTTTGKIVNQGTQFTNAGQAAYNAIKIITGSDGEAAIATVTDVSTGKVISQGTQFTATGAAASAAIKATVGSLQSSQDPQVDASTGKVTTLVGKWTDYQTTAGTSITTTVTALSSTQDPQVDSSAQKVTDDFTTAWQAASDSASKSAGDSTTSIQTEQSNVSDLMSGLDTSISGNWQDVSQAASKSATDSTQAIQKEQGDVSGFGAALETALSGNWGDISAAAVKSSTDSSGAVSTAGQAIQSTMSATATAVDQDWADIDQAANKAAADCSSEFAAATTNIVGSVNSVGAAFDVVANTHIAAATAAIKGATTATQGLAIAGTGAGSAFQSAMALAKAGVDGTAGSATILKGNIDDAAQATNSLTTAFDGAYSELEDMNTAADILANTMLQVQNSMSGAKGGGGKGGTLGNFTGDPQQIMQQLQTQLGSGAGGFVGGVPSQMQAILVNMLTQEALDAIAQYNALNPGKGYYGTGTTTTTGTKTTSPPTTTSPGIPTTPTTTSPDTTGGGGTFTLPTGTMLVQDIAAEASLAALVTGMTTGVGAGAGGLGGGVPGGTTGGSGGTTGGGFTPTAPPGTGLTLPGNLPSINYVPGMGTSQQPNLFGPNAPLNPPPGISYTPGSALTPAGQTTFNPAPVNPGGAVAPGGAGFVNLQAPIPTSAGVTNIPTPATMGAGSPTQTMAAMGISTQSIQQEIAQLIASGMSAQQASTMSAGDLSSAVAALGQGPAAGNMALTGAQATQFAQLAAQLGVTGMPTAPGSPTAPQLPGGSGGLSGTMTGGGSNQPNVVNVYNPTVQNSTLLGQMVTQIQNAGINTQ